MCTLGRTAAGTARKADNKPDRARIPAWDGQEGNDDGAKRCRCHFLTTPLRPIAPEHVQAGEENDGYELVTQENYEYLRDSYLRYAELMEATPNHRPGASLGESINNVYREMRALIGDKPNLNIEENGGRLYFNLWAYYEWGKYMVYYFPVKFIEELNPRLKRIAISFFNGLMHANGFSTIMEEYDLDIVLEWMTDTQCQTDEEVEKAKALKYSYDCGRAFKLLETVWKKSYHKNLKAAVDRYMPQNELERSLINAMQEGMEFIYTDRGLMHYAYDPYFDEECDYPPIPLDRQIRVLYDADDIVSDGILDYFNCEQRETYEITPVRCMALSPHTDKLFSMGDNYPERFFKWATKFIDIIS